MPARFMAASAAVLALSAYALSACGDTRATKTVTVTTAAASPRSDAPTTHAKKAKRRKTRPKAAMSRLTACDANISVKTPHTTCPFAENVFYGYWLNKHDPGVFADSPGLPAYSPAAGRMFFVDCSGTSTIVCRGGDGAYVRFPIVAVSAYTVAQAKRYAEHAQLGDVPAPRESSEEAPPPPSQSDSGADCDPNYEGACLDPNSPDYDCAGGSGDGPDYTGPVEVVGDDRFGLDRDGDGSACES
jgi:ribosomal protein L32